MKKLTFIAEIECTDRNEIYYIHNDIEANKKYLKSFIGKKDFERIHKNRSEKMLIPFEEVKPNEVFEFEGLKIFSYFNGKALVFTDHLTGMKIGTFNYKEDCISYLRNNLGSNGYENLIREQVLKNGISPAYKINLFDDSIIQP